MTRRKYTNFVIVPGHHNLVVSSVLNYVVSLSSISHVFYYPTGDSWSIYCFCRYPFSPPFIDDIIYETVLPLSWFLEYSDFSIHPNPLFIRYK